MGGSSDRQGEKSLLHILREADAHRPAEDGKSLGRGLVRLAHLASAVHRYQAVADLETSEDSLLMKASSGA
ncbi:hypothetical protein KS4_07180 [Poriferisphaera corsica]|uniref:Uncharacterized protein n=1 Tax=Poriferisphaera corsica TaxID=2528020 RepID=A0A517YR32_9BACT|nr:hypothetical protein [Poriferisphaera corsica]QDU32684.1 hypothetical protein KS4_07180 [Poriferisphaera corsica]